MFCSVDEIVLWFSGCSEFRCCFLIFFVLIDITTICYSYCKKTDSRFAMFTVGGCWISLKLSFHCIIAYFVVCVFCIVCLLVSFHFSYLSYVNMAFPLLSISFRYISLINNKLLYLIQTSSFLANTLQLIRLLRPLLMVVDWLLPIFLVFLVRWRFPENKQTHKFILKHRINWHVWEYKSQNDEVTSIVLWPPLSFSESLPTPLACKNEKIASLILPFVAIE